LYAPSTQIKVVIVGCNSFCFKPSVPRISCSPTIYEKFLTCISAFDKCRVAIFTVSPASQTGSEWTKDSLIRANAPQCVPARVVQNCHFALKHAGRCKIYLIARRETDVLFPLAVREHALGTSSAAA